MTDEELKEQTMNQKELLLETKALRLSIDQLNQHIAKVIAMLPNLDMLKGLAGMFGGKDKKK